jgi:hypothetical protein
MAGWSIGANVLVHFLAEEAALAGTQQQSLLPVSGGSCSLYVLWRKFGLQIQQGLQQYEAVDFVVSAGVWVASIAAMNKPVACTAHDLAGTAGYPALAIRAACSMCNPFELQLGHENWTGPKAGFRRM